MDNLPNTVTVDTKFSLNSHRPGVPDVPTPPVPEKKKMSKTVKYSVVFSAILVLFLFLGSGIYFMSSSGFKRSAQPQIYYQSADSVGVFKPENSYLFASPLQAKAGSGEKIRVSVFLLDDQGKGVADKEVTLGQDPRLIITAVQPITDSLGRALFDIESKTVADFFIEAFVNAQAIPQKVRLSFK